MSDRIEKDDLGRRLATRMNVDAATAHAWIDALTKTLYERFKGGESVTLRGSGSCYVREERRNRIFRFNPGQRLGAVLGWSLSNKGKR
jgi:nucleoid DNA-binding protein